MSRKSWGSLIWPSIKNHHIICILLRWQIVKNLILTTANRNFWIGRKVYRPYMISWNRKCRYTTNYQMKPLLNHIITTFCPVKVQKIFRLSIFTKFWLKIRIRYRKRESCFIRESTISARSNFFREKTKNQFNTTPLGKKQVCLNC